MYIYLGSARTVILIQFKTLWLLDNFGFALFEMLKKCQVHADQSYSNLTNTFLLSFIYMQYKCLSLFQTNSFFHHNVLFSPVSFVFKVFLLGHLASLQHADNKMQFSELLSTDAPVCYRDHRGTSLAVAGMLPV